MLHIYTFKWGTKYGPHYVNRLKNSIKQNYKGKFLFHCITDNKDGIDKDIIIIDYNNFKTSGDSVFTVEKLELMYNINTENNLLLDLDILIHNDITDLCNHIAEKPTFVYTHWTPSWYWDKMISRKEACFINGSFIKWSKENAKFLFYDYISNRQKYLNEYDSCDKYIFYEHYLKDKYVIDFWPEGIFYSYNSEVCKKQFKEDHKCCIFNTSHLIKMNRECYELENTPDWAADIWENYEIVK